MWSEVRRRWRRGSETNKKHTIESKMKSGSRQTTTLFIRKLYSFLNLLLLCKFYHHQDYIGPGKWRLHNSAQLLSDHNPLHSHRASTTMDKKPTLPLPFGFVFFCCCCCGFNSEKQGSSAFFLGLSYITTEHFQHTTWRRTQLNCRLWTGTRAEGLDEGRFPQFIVSPPLLGIHNRENWFVPFFRDPKSRRGQSVVRARLLRRVCLLRWWCWRLLLLRSPRGTTQSTVLVLPRIIDPLINHGRKRVRRGRIGMLVGRCPYRPARERILLENVGSSAARFFCFGQHAERQVYKSQEIRRGGLIPPQYCCCCCWPKVKQQLTFRSFVIIAKIRDRYYYFAAVATTINPNTLYGPTRLFTTYNEWSLSVLIICVSRLPLADAQAEEEQQQQQCAKK